MLTKSTKSILRALALILAVLMTASVCLVGCTDKNAQTAADEAKAAADAAKALAQEAKDAATSAVSDKTLNDELAKAVDQAKAQATADIANALADYAKKADLDALSATAINALSAELAKKVNTGDVYTKAEIDSKLAALGGNTATGDASEAIAKALADAKAYTDAAIAKVGTGAVAGDLSEAAIAQIIAAAFEDYDKVTAALVLAIGDIYMDCLQIACKSYLPDDFKTVYSFVEKYVSLNLDEDEEFTGAIDQQLKFDAFSAIPTLLSLLRMSSTEKLAAVVADFDAAAAVVSIDDKVKELADAILDFGEEKELTAVPKDYLYITDSDCRIFEYKEYYYIPVVPTYEDFVNWDRLLEGTLYAAGAAYEKGDLIYVANADKETYSILRVTEDVEKAGATPTDFAVPATAIVVTVNDWAKYETLLAKVDAFVAEVGYVSGTNIRVDVKKSNNRSKVWSPKIASFVEDAFTVVSGTDSTIVAANFPKFGEDYEPIVPCNYEPGIFELITSLGTYFTDDGEVAASASFAAYGNFEKMLNDMGVSVENDFYYLNGSNDDFGEYVGYVFEHASQAYGFAAKELKNFVDAALKAVVTKTDLGVRVYTVAEVSDAATAAEKAAAYKVVVEALEKAIKDYELFNLGNNAAISDAKTYLVLAKATYDAYNVSNAQKELDYLHEREYKECLSKFVNMLTVEYKDETEMYKNQTGEFIKAADEIIKNAYFEAIKVSYAVAAPKIAATKIATFSDALDKYMTDTYYTQVRKDIKEAYAEYSWWLTIQKETEGYLKDYYNQYVNKVATATDSSLAYFVSTTDVNANKYYTIGEVLFGCEENKDLKKAALTGKFNAIGTKLTADIAAFMDVTPAKGTYLASCEKVLGLINDAVLAVGETYLAEVNAAKLETVDDKAAGMTDKALADVLAEFDASKTDILKVLPDDVVTLGLDADIAKLVAALKKVAAADKNYPVMSLIGDDDVVTFSDLITGKELFNFDNQYEIALEDAKSALMEIVYQTWFVAYQNKCYKEMSEYYKGNVGGVMYDDIQDASKVDVLLCMTEMSKIFENGYTTLYALKLDFVVSATDSTVVGDFAALKAYCAANKLDIVAQLNATKEAKTIIMDDIVDLTEGTLYDYATNRAEYNKDLKDAQALVDAIEKVNALKKFYVAGSKFDLALTALKNVIKKAQYVPAKYTVDASTDTGKAFVTASDLGSAGYGFNFDLNNGSYDAKASTWEAKSYMDARLYAEWCISDAELVLADLWVNSNPLHNNILLTEEEEAEAEKLYDTISDTVVKLLDVENPFKKD